MKCIQTGKRLKLKLFFDSLVTIWKSGGKVIDKEWADDSK